VPPPTSIMVGVWHPPPTDKPVGGAKPMSIAALLSIGGSAAAGGGPSSPTGRGGDVPPRLVGGLARTRSGVLTASLTLGLRVAGGGQSTAWSSDVICSLLCSVQWVMLPWGGLLEHLSAACASAGSSSQSDCAGSAVDVHENVNNSSVVTRPGCRPVVAAGGSCILREQHGPRASDAEGGCVCLLVLGDWDAGGGGMLKSVATGLGRHRGLLHQINVPL